MKASVTGPLKLHAAIEKWPLVAPFRITGYTWEHLETLFVRLETAGCVGQGEAAGVYYRKDSPALMLKQIEALRDKIEAGVDRETLQTLLPPGGARNALDCALWDLEAKIAGEPAWRIAGLKSPQPIITTLTCGAETPEKMATAARNYHAARAIKLKLTGDPVDPARVMAVRAARSDVWLGIDANQGFTCESLDALMPSLIESRVSLIEQPFPVGQEAWLDQLESPIPIAADETCQALSDLPGLVGHFSVVNIKLDKCGGLTEALAMARAAHRLGLKTMVGNMLGTSLGMAPAFLVGQLCEVVDLDGPVFLKMDRLRTVEYVDGLISSPDSVWGGAR
jgi:L-alanine-DL-glutamate epimerase-like enolase superfamily enzyme